MKKTEEAAIKWPEIFSLGALNVSVVISWIAYHEYQPLLLEKFEFNQLSDFLIIAKGIILVLTPPLAGLLADYLLKRTGKYFTIFSIGIGVTAMIFMIVATIIGAGPLGVLKPFLPYMIILWLISMNLFISPAFSMIEAFAPAQKLPIVMGFLIFITEIVYALEPLIVGLVQFFGDTLTFVVGGLLISISGYFFHRISSDEVVTRREELKTEKKVAPGFQSFLVIVLLGLMLGVAKAFLVEFIPSDFLTKFPEIGESSQYISFGLLGLSAVLAFALSRFLMQFKPMNVLLISVIVIAVGCSLLLLSSNFALAISGGAITAIGFSALNVTGLPFAINILSVKHITYGVGVYIGASEIFTGWFEYILK